MFVFFLLAPLLLDSQDQSAFLRNGQQQIFRALPQGCLYTPAFCHGMGLESHIVILSTSMKALGYLDGVMPISEYFGYLESCLKSRKVIG